MNTNKKPSFNDHNVWPNGKHLEFVNGGQILNDLKTKIPWVGSTNPITDMKSIVIRQDGLKLLYYNKKLASVPFENFYPPSISQRFFIDFGKDSSFNEKVGKLKYCLENALDESRDVLNTTIYQEILEDLKNQHAEVLVTEEEVVEKLKKELENIYAFRGTASVSSALLPQRTMHEKEPIKVKNESYGVQEFAFSNDEPWFCKFSRWLLRAVYSKWWGDEVNGRISGFFLNLLQCVVGIACCLLCLLSILIVSWADMHKTDTLFTKKLPLELENTFYKLHENLLAEFKNTMISDLQKLQHKNYEAKEIDDLCGSIIISSSFEFSLTPNEGLQVRLVDIQQKIRKLKDRHIDKFNEGWKNPFQTDEKLFQKSKSLYTWMQEKWMEQQAYNHAKRVGKRFIYKALQRSLNNAINEYEMRLSDDKKLILQQGYTAILKEIKYRNINEAILGLNLKEKMDRVQLFQKDVLTLAGGFRQVQSHVTEITKVRETYKNLPFCFPEILPDEHNIVEFHNIAPLHLIDRPTKDNKGTISIDDLRLIPGLPSLNGQMVSITGANGGGKTVTEISLINCLYLAHMGFPVFAENFKFNVKQVVAVVFVEKGEGSMLELLMKKLTAVAQAIKENKNNKIVVIIDELLTGTQEKKGLIIGKKYLKMLAESKCSVLFVTQITDLAEYAKSSLNALCFHYDTKGVLKPGIGEGAAEHLAEVVGLNEYLEK